MTGYLQRLLDSALPASDPPTLRPVVKSTSPVFEQNQLLGLAGLDDAELDVEAAPYLGEAPTGPVPSAPLPLRPISIPAVPAPAILPQDFNLPVTPTSPAAVPEPLFVETSPTPSAVASAAPSHPEPPGWVLAPAAPDPESFAPGPGPETAPVAAPERIAELPARLVPQEPLPAKADSAPEPAPNLQPHERKETAGVRFVTRDEAPDVEPIVRRPDAPPPQPILEPRPRPRFDDANPHPEQVQTETVQAPPRITIGRVTVELVPDRAPAAQPARVSRTAAAASVIGPLGNRRARRRLFALNRL